MTNNIAKPVLYGIIASAILLGVYFAALTSVSGSDYMATRITKFKKKS